MTTVNIKRSSVNKCISSAITEMMPAESSSSSSSPANKVVSIDDLLTAILFRLPVRSLFRFKSVSKHWYFLITNPRFKLLRSRNPDPPSGLFVPFKINDQCLQYEFVPFDIENPVKAPFTTPKLGPNVAGINIEHSSNGLMLCSSRCCDVIEEDKFVYQYYVYNPTINQFVTLPTFENYENSKRLGMTLLFDPSKSPEYRVICVCGLGTNNLTNETNYQIEIFSSIIRTCKPSCQFSFDTTLYLDLKGGVYWNNAIHWIQYEGCVLYFNLDEESIHEKQTPLRLLGQDAYSNCIFESRDQLLLVELNMFYTSNFKIHKLKRDYSAWSLKYHVDLKEIGGSFPEIMDPRLAIRFEFVVLSIVLGEKEDDSFLVLEIRGKALRFNLVTKAFHKLHDIPASRYYKPNRVFSGLPKGFQFRESLYSF